MNEMGLVMLEVTYGRMTAEQADAELARREEAAQRSEAPIAAQLVD